MIKNFTILAILLAMVCLYLIATQTWRQALRWRARWYVRRFQAEQDFFDKESLQKIPSVPPAAVVIEKIATSNATMISHAVLPDHKINPKQGSWYLSALPDEDLESLKRTFDQLPFDAALDVLRRLNAPARRQVLRRLPIIPAIKTRMQKALDSNY